MGRCFGAPGTYECQLLCRIISSHSMAPHLSVCLSSSCPDNGSFPLCLEGTRAKGFRSLSPRTQEDYRLGTRGLPLLSRSVAWVSGRSRAWPSAEGPGSCSRTQLCSYLDDRCGSQGANLRSPGAWGYRTVLSSGGLVGTAHTSRVFCPSQGHPWGWGLGLCPRSVSPRPNGHRGRGLCSNGRCVCLLTSF